MSAVTALPPQHLPSPVGPPPVRRAAGTRRRRLRGAGLLLIAGIPVTMFALFFFYPVGTLLGRGLAPGGVLDLTGAAQARVKPRVQSIAVFTVCQAAASAALAVLLGLPGAFVLYLLLKLAVAVASGIVIALLGCLTCCIAFLPVVMQVVFQPLFFLERAFPVLLLRQLGYDVRARLLA